MPNSFYIITFLVVCGVFFNLLYRFLFRPLFTRKKIIKEIYQVAKQLQKECVIFVKHVDDSDLLVKVSDKLFLVKIIYVKKNCDLQINNIDAFFMYTKTLSKDLKYKELGGLKTFMNSQKPNRVIVLSKKAATIKKVINECEMIMVDETTDIYKAHILNQDYNYFFKD